MDIDENRIYKVLIIAVIVSAIIVSFAVFWFRITLYQEKDSFSEIYFPDPYSLPNKIKVGQNYEYEFIIKSDENETKKLNFSYGMELYNLYESTEAKYRCLSEYRQKIFLDWTNKTDNFTLMGQPGRIDAIQNLITPPVYSRFIDWDHYTIVFKFSKGTGLGQLTFFFRNETDVKYFITFDTNKNTTSFNNQVKGSGFSLDNQNNWVIIEVEKDKLIMTVNGRDVLSATYRDLYGGQIGFESQDSYFSVSNVLAFKESPVVIPDDQTIVEFSIDQNFLFNKMRELETVTSRSLLIRRQFSEWNETIDCESEPFYCEFFDIPNDISFFQAEPNLTRLVEKIPVEEEAGNYKITATQPEQAYIDWQDFNISFQHTTLRSGSKAQIILKFGEQWAIMITRNNSYFIRPVDENTEQSTLSFAKGDVSGKFAIDEIRNPIKTNASQENVEIKVTKGVIILKIANQTIFAKTPPVNYTGGILEMYIKNDFLSISTIEMRQNNPECDDQFSFTFCSLILSSSVARPRIVEQQQEFEIQTIDYEETAKAFSLVEKETPDPTFIDINIPVYNPYIPDKRMVFNTLPIVNSSNFSIEYSYQGLDGARVMELGIISNNTETLSMYVRERQDSIIFYNGKEFSIFSMYINQSTSHSLKIGVQGNQATFSFDRRPIFITPANVKDGLFFAGTKNTHADLGGARIFIKPSTRNIRLQSDPCEFRPVYTEEDTKSITLAPNRLLRVTNSFNAWRDFDYGKVYVKLFGSGNTTEPLEIHFWVIRDDT